MNKDKLFISVFLSFSLNHNLGAFSLSLTLNILLLIYISELKQFLLSQIKYIVYSYLNKGVPCRVCLYINVIKFVNFYCFTLTVLH